MIHRYGLYIITALTAAIVVLMSCSSSLHPVNVGEGGAAIKGYDPVAYFTEGKPGKSSDQFAFQWKGAKWLFSSKENLGLFMANPEQFAPQYGGY